MMMIWAMRIADFQSVSGRFCRRDEYDAEIAFLLFRMPAFHLLLRAIVVDECEGSFRNLQESGERVLFYHLPW